MCLGTEETNIKRTLPSPHSRLELNPRFRSPQYPFPRLDPFLFSICLAAAMHVHLYLPSVLTAILPVLASPITFSGVSRVSAPEFKIREAVVGVRMDINLNTLVCPPAFSLLKPLRSQCTLTCLPTIFENQT